MSGARRDATPRGSWVARHPLLLAWLVTIAVRVPVALATRLPGIDESIMGSYGISWLRTGVDSGLQWPVTYPLLSGALSMLVGWRLAVEGIFVVIGSLVVVPFYFGMRLLRGAEAARWAALLLALLPACGTVVAKSGSHSLFLPLLGLCFWLFARCLLFDRARDLAALGAALGLGYVTRTDGLVTWAVVALSFLVAPKGEHGGALRSRARRTAIVLAAGGVLVLANVLHLRQGTGRWGFSAVVGQVVEKPFYIGGLKDETLARMTDEFTRDTRPAVERVMAHPGYFARKLGYNLRLFLKALGDIHVFPAPLFVLLGLALPSLLAPARTGLFVLVTWALPPLAFIPLNIEPRYFSPLAVILAAFAGAGLAQWRLAASRRAFAITAGAAFGLLLLAGAMLTVMAHEEEEPLVREKAEAVAEAFGDELPSVFVLRPHLRFLLDARPGMPRTLPITQECCAGVYVLDPDDTMMDERARLDALDGGSAALRLERTLPHGLEVWRRAR